MSAALLEQIESEETSRTLYGEEEALAPDFYEVLFNQRDRDRCGKLVIEGVQKHLSGKVSAEKLARLTLASGTANIDGGLILRIGSVEINNSIEAIFSYLRPRLEAEVAKILFPTKKGEERNG